MISVRRQGEGADEGGPDRRHPERKAQCQVGRRGRFGGRKGSPQGGRHPPRQVPSGKSCRMWHCLMNSTGSHTGMVSRAPPGCHEESLLADSASCTVSFEHLYSLPSVFHREAEAVERYPAVRPAWDWKVVLGQSRGNRGGLDLLQHLVSGAAIKEPYVEAFDLSSVQISTLITPIDSLPCGRVTSSRTWCPSGWERVKNLSANCSNWRGNHRHPSSSSMR